MFKLRQLRCSFCYKKESQVRKLVAGPRVYICDECCAIASRIMSDSSGEVPSSKPTVWQKIRARLEDLTGVDLFSAT
jgi:ATP-dependent protease Clp ATPase subunit